MAWQESWLRVGRALGLISDINETEDLCARVAEMLLSKECPSLAAFVKQVSPGQRVYPHMPSIKDALKTPGCELYLGVEKCSSSCYAKEVDDLQVGVAPLRRVYIYLMLHLAAEKSGRVTVIGLRRKNKSRGNAESWGRMTAQGSGARGGNKVIMLEYRVWQNAWHDAKAATAPPVMKRDFKIVDKWHNNSHAQNQIGISDTNSESLKTQIDEMTTLIMKINR